MQGNPTPTPASIGAQPAAAFLTSLLAASNGLLEKTGANTAGSAPIGPAGRDVLAATSQAGARTAIGVNTGTTEGTIPVRGAGGSLTTPSDWLTITLTLSPGWTAGGARANSLKVNPVLRLGIISCGLGREDGGVTFGQTIYTWTGYSAPEAIASVPAYSAPFAGAYVSGSTLRVDTGATSISFMTGQIIFTW